MFFKNAGKVLLAAVIACGFAFMGTRADCSDSKVYTIRIGSISPGCSFALQTPEAAEGSRSRYSLTARWEGTVKWRRPSRWERWIWC